MAEGMTADGAPDILIHRKGRKEHHILRHIWTIQRTAHRLILNVGRLCRIDLVHCLELVRRVQDPLQGIGEILCRHPVQNHLGNRLLSLKGFSLRLCPNQLDQQLRVLLTQLKIRITGTRPEVSGPDSGKAPPAPRRGHKSTPRCSRRGYRPPESPRKRTFADSNGYSCSGWDR